jgi:protein SCO1/2
MAVPGRTRRVLPVFLILFLAPVVVIIIFKFGKNNYKQLPYIGLPVGIDAKGDTIRHTIPSFSFATDQNGQPFGSDSLKGKIYIADFFFTSCPNICPLLTHSLIRVQDRFKNDNDFRVVSFSLDPQRDSAETLKQYAAKYKITTSQWHFLTAPKDSIYDLMGPKGYLIVKPILGADADQLQHSEVVVLIDKEGHIRGSYNGLKEDEMDKLIEDAHTLYVLYARQSRK